MFVIYAVTESGYAEEHGRAETLVEAEAILAACRSTWPNSTFEIREE